MKKRLLAIILAVVMAMSLLPMSALAAEDTTTNQIVSNGIEETAGKEQVKTSKIITQTGENQFDVTLTVKTKETIESQTVSKDAAVVLVLDMSNSMTSSDMNNARSAAKNFIDEFVKNAGDGQRQVAIVEFGSNAKTVLGWTDAATESGVTAAKQGVDDVQNQFSYSVMCSKTGTHTHSQVIHVESAEVEYRNHIGGMWDGWYCTTCDKRISQNNSQNKPENTAHDCAQEVQYDGTHPISEKDGGGTNIEGGLILAKNLLNDSAVNGITNTYVVMMTDGVPTFYVSDGDENTGSTTFMAGTRGGGNSASHNDYHDIYCTQTGKQHTDGDNVPQKIKDTGAKLYTVSYKNTNMTVNGQTIDAWLTAFSTQSIAAGEDIFSGLQSIAQIIVNQAQAWILTDPMGEYIDFVRNPAKFAEVTNATESSSDAVIKFNTDTETLIWNLKNDVANRRGPDSEGWYTYTLSYSITLDTLKTGFKAGQGYATNGTTSLTYMLTQNGQLNPTLYTTNLTVPVVKGFDGTVSFQKVSSVGSGTGLSGAEFQLTTADKSGWEMTTISEADGSVTFSNVPSGHTYTLTETKAPAGYSKNTETYSVEVEWGNAVIKDSSETPITSIANTPITGSLTITKVDSENANIKLSGATFTLTPVNPTEGTSLTATSNENGVATFSSIPLGTYTLTETTAPNGYLDSSDVYSVSVTAANGVTTTTVTKGDKTDSDGAITVENVKQTVNTTIAKAADKTVYAPGETVTYTITLTNTGNSADKVTVVDTLPTELKDYTSTSNISNGGTYDAATGKITWTNVSVGAQGGDTAGTTTLTYQVNIPTDIALKSYTNTAVIQGQSGDGKTATATITVEATDLMTPEKTVNTTTVAPNGELTYTITVKNAGNKNAAVTITDVIPDGLTLVAGSITEGGQLGLDGKTITWSNVTVPAATVQNETLTPGAVSVSFTAKVPADVENGHKYINTAVVTEGEKEFTTDPVETVVDNLSATISGTKNVAQGGNVSVPADAEFTFSLTLVKINGNAAENGYTDTVTSGKGDFSFQPIKYTEAGTYVYEVKETAGSAANWTYDDTTYTVTVIVSRDANDGKLVASAPVYSVGDTSADKITFTNTYTKNATIPVKPSKPPVLNTEDHYGYIVGYPDGTVRPEGTITRAEVATIFFRLLTDESRSEYWSQTCSYSDVAASDWFNNAVCTLSNAGLITGYEDGTFRPNSTITRAEFATIASRFFEYADKTYENPFSDVDEGAWYYNYVMAASDMGLINGYPDGTFGPQKSITRAEAVTIVNRTLDRHPDEDHLLDDMIIWPDNQKSDWYYADVQEATNSHEYQMSTSSSGKYEIWTQILPIRDWAAYEKAWSDANSASGGEVMP